MLKDNLRALRRERGLTLLELGERIGTSKQTIQRYECGIIDNIPKEKIEALARALGVTPARLMGWDATDETLPLEYKKLPMLGEIACGEPIFASEEHGVYAAVGSDVEADFCLTAHGNSMIGARICDGDIVFIRAQSTVNNGEIAAVIIGDDATLKRVYYYPEEGKLVLMPENVDYAPLVYQGTELEGVKIIGRAVGFQSKVT